MKTSIKNISLFILVFLFNASCTKNPATVKQYYRLDPPALTTHADTYDKTLWIKKPEAYSILGNRPIVATNASGALQQLNFHNWIESPKILIQEQIQKYLSSQWAEVVTTRPREGEYYQLHTHISAFEKLNNSANITLTFKFYSQDLALISQQSLSQTLTLKDDSYAGFVQRMSEAIDTIFKQLALKP